MFPSYQTQISFEVFVLSLSRPISNTTLTVRYARRSTHGCFPFYIIPSLSRGPPNCRNSSPAMTFLAIPWRPALLLSKICTLAGTLNDCGDLVHGSTDWPLTIISRILWLSTALTHLTIVGLDQNKWHLLEHAVPASLECLSLGPVHGPFRPQALTRRPRLRSFTSAATYMRDDEVLDHGVLADDARCSQAVRGCGHHGRDNAAEQVGCVAWTDTLERLEVVVYGGERAVVHRGLPQICGRRRRRSLRISGSW